MPAPVLLVSWIAVMLLAAAGAGWLVLSRFPEVFFGTGDWRQSRRGRAVRRLLLAVMVVSGLAVLVGAGLLLFGAGRIE